MSNKHLKVVQDNVNVCAWVSFSNYDPESYAHACTNGADVLFGNNCHGIKSFHVQMNVKIKETHKKRYLLTVIQTWTIIYYFFLCCSEWVNYIGVCISRSRDGWHFTSMTAITVTWAPKTSICTKKISIQNVHCLMYKNDLLKTQGKITLKCIHNMLH